MLKLMPVESVMPSNHLDSSEDTIEEWHASHTDMRIRSLGQKDALEEEMATHSSILAWEIPGTEEPGGLRSMGSHTLVSLAFCRGP